MVVLYVAFGAALLWYNEPALVEGVGAGQQSAWALVGLLGARTDLLVLLLILVPAVVVGVLLPHRPDWR